MRDGAAVSRALGGKRIRGGWQFRCPCHNDRKPSAAISDRSGLVTCFAHCDRKELEAALDALGFPDDRQRAPRNREQEWAERQKRVREVQQMWEDLAPSSKQWWQPAFYDVDPLRRQPDEHIALVANYLKERRNILLPVPAVIRRWSINGYMACLQQLDDEITAVHTRTASGRRTTYGPTERGAVRLTQPLNGELGIAEGVESALSATQLFQIPCWASLGSKRLDHIAIPPGIRTVHLFIDHDQAGLAALARATRAYSSAGYQVRQWIPPAVGQDWNDYLRELGDAET
jgi:putative DNA primase/helicase